jgi:hypothetical protein
MKVSEDFAELHWSSHNPSVNMGKYTRPASELIYELVDTTIPALLARIEELEREKKEREEQDANHTKALSMLGRGYDAITNDL